MAARTAPKAPQYTVPPRHRSLGYLWMWWLERHCIVPDREDAGAPFDPTVDHRVWLANWGEIRPTAKAGDAASAFRYSHGQWMAAQKVGKSPGVAAEALLEFVGPARFHGFAAAGDVYLCAEHGCPCGGVYFYELGEPKGRPWATPRIQLAALVEEQVENTWSALLAMATDGPLANVIHKANWNFIRHPSGNRNSEIEIVTSAARSRLGARVTAVKCDETALWNEGNRMKEFMRTVSRGAAAMGGRVSESTNPYDPAELSVAQDTYESKARDVLRHHFPPPAHLDFTRKLDRSKILAWNYASSPWVDLRDIESKVVQLLPVAPAETERFYGNRIVAGSAAWLDVKRWAKRAAPATVRPRTKVAAGFDGSDNDDTTGIRLETLDGYQFTPVYGDQRLKTFWRPQDWGGRIPRAEVMTAWEVIFADFDVVRAYCDPFFWESELDTLASMYGEKKIIKWPTNRLTAMHGALERFRTDVYNPEAQFSHDGDADVEAHHRNAVVRNRSADPSTGVRRYFLGKPNDAQKIDLTMSSVLAHEAAMDAIAAGQAVVAESLVYY